MVCVALAAIVVGRNNFSHDLLVWIEEKGIWIEEKGISAIAVA
jgi:hypothetical protein